MNSNQLIIPSSSKYHKFDTTSSITGPGYTASKDDYVDDFNKLLKKWRAETLWMSSITDAIEHASFIEITRMGDKVIPLIISALEVQPDLLVAALPILLPGEDPVRDEDRGDIVAMAEAWIELWRNRG